MSMLSSLVLAALFVWPWLRTSHRDRALIWLAAPHMFLRFIGLSFLVPGVVSDLLPKAWAVPAGYGDLVAGILAIIATAALSRTPWVIAAVWIFNVWGAADLRFALFQGDAHPAGARFAGCRVLHRNGDSSAPARVALAHLRPSDARWTLMPRVY